MKNQTFRMTMLFDFYGELLTERQREFYQLYYDEDLSLSEIAEQRGNEPEYAVGLVMTHHDDPRGIHFAWQDEGYRVILTFPMDDFGWPHPLVLCGDGLTYEELREILRGICLEGRGTESFPVIMNEFRNVKDAAFEASGADGGEGYDSEEKEGT